MRIQRGSGPITQRAKKGASGPRRHGRPGARLGPENAPDHRSKPLRPYPQTRLGEMDRRIAQPLLGQGASRLPPILRLEKLRGPAKAAGMTEELPAPLSQPFRRRGRGGSPFRSFPWLCCSLPSAADRLGLDLLDFPASLPLRLPPLSLRRFGARKAPGRPLHDLLRPFGQISKAHLYPHPCLLLLVHALSVGRRPVAAHPASFLSAQNVPQLCAAMGGDSFFCAKFARGVRRVPQPWREPSLRWGGDPSATKRTCPVEPPGRSIGTAPARVFPP